MKYKTSILIIVFIFLLAEQPHAQTCPCTATTKKASQQRSGAKHETNYAGFILKEDTIDVDYIDQWQKTYTAKTNTIKTAPASPASKRKHGTPEDSLYILQGYMWFVKVESNDCDFHIEIGTADSSDNRIVVEVPRENIALQKKIRAKLDELGLKILKCTTSNMKLAHFADPIPVVVTGLGFYDASHKPNTNHGDAHTKKYSWELHPVQNIEFLEL